MDGIINVYKEKGFTSHDVVAKLRGILKQKKIGHTGTLDPDATGVLPVCLGKATKLCDLLTDKDKEYEAVIRIGIRTDTQDISGNIIEEKEYRGEEAFLRQTIESFKGDIMQIPPMYSAIKVNGKKLYELARKGEVIEREARKCRIHEIEIISISDDLKRVSVRTKVSKGTYIRTLCDDIGKKLGCGACMEELIRTRSGSFELENALTLSQIEEKVKNKSLEKSIIHIQSVFSMPCFMVKEEYEKYLLNGNKLEKRMLLEYKVSRSHSFINTSEDDICVYYSDGSFAAIYRAEKQDKNIYSVYKMF